MREHKIVVLGAMGAGKSTMVRAVATGAVVDTDVANTDASSSKQATTVAMDYADVELPNGDRLRLYGTPGQARFDFIWTMLLEGASGVIVLLDATVDDLAADVTTYLQPLAAHGRALPVVIGISKADRVPLPDLDRINEHAAACLRPLPLVPFDARSRDEVLMLMDVLMSEVEAIEIAG
jgi:small GTP-binding protein